MIPMSELKVGSTFDSSGRFDELTQNTYEYTLKFLLLEYINEPRFRNFEYTLNNKHTSHDDDFSRNKSGDGTKPNFERNSISEHEIFFKVLVNLEKYLTKLTMKNEDNIEVNFRRSLLKFYNDVFLGSKAAQIISSLSSIEETILRFVKTAATELSKIQCVEIQHEVHGQTVSFIDLIIKILPPNVPVFFEQKLNKHKDIVISQGGSGKQMQSVVNNSRTPTFRVSELTHGKYFMHLFKIDELKLQQDMVRYMKAVRNEIYYEELCVIRAKVLVNEWTKTSDDFRDEPLYLNWKQEILENIDDLIQKYNSTKQTKKNPALQNIIFPKNPIPLLQRLMELVFINESKSSTSISNFSHEANYYITKTAKLWLSNYHSTFAPVLLKAAHHTILNGAELNIIVAESVFDYISRRSFTTEKNADTSLWNDEDQKQWLSIILIISKQFFHSISNLLSQVLMPTKPKFSPLLAFYYEYLDTEPSFSLYRGHDADYMKRYNKSLRKVIFKCCESYYIQLLNEIPRDNSIEFYHLQDVAEKIVEQIRKLQNKYKSLLLDEISITKECGSFLVRALVTDIPAIVARIEKCQNSIIAAEALRCYSILLEIKNIFSQIISDKPFPIDLEKLFLKYLLKLCDEASQKVVIVISNSVENEEWKQINEVTPYSSSVLDIFKMINESISIFRKLEWGNESEYAVVLTFILKSFSDGLNMYTNILLNHIKDDLGNDTNFYNFQIEEESRLVNTLHTEMSNKKQTLWNLTDLKSSLLANAIKLPKPYEYSSKTCVILNNLDAMIQEINELDGKIDAEKLCNSIDGCKNLIANTNELNDLTNIESHAIYVIRIVSAHNLEGPKNKMIPNFFVTLVDSTKKNEFGKTTIKTENKNPIWNEEFEIETLSHDITPISLNIWHHPMNKIKLLDKMEICGTATLVLNPKKFTKDGLPNEVTIDLNTKGTLVLQVSLEIEKFNPLFYIGRSYRTLTTAKEQAIELIVSKFSSFIRHCLSKDSLISLCGKNGNKSPTRSQIYDTLLPLFDYLNANLNILAAELTPNLLHLIILEVWNQILKTADSVLLPSLNVVRSDTFGHESKQRLWSETFAAALKHTMNFVGNIDTLSQFQIEVMFMWLRSICDEFLHNNGEGPPIESLRNDLYHRLLLIPASYDKTVPQLKSDFESYLPAYKEYLEKVVVEIDDKHHMSKRKATLLRQKTIMANASNKARQKIKEEIANMQTSSLERISDQSDILLRCLIAKGEIDYVVKHLAKRDDIKYQLALEKKMNNAVNGHLVN